METVLAHIDGAAHIHGGDVVIIIVAAMVTTAIIGFYREFIEKE